MRELELEELERDTDIIKAARLVYASVSDPSAPPLQLNPGGPSLRDIWTKLRFEVHDLLCTDSAKYQKERILFQNSYKPAIVALAAYLTKDYGLPTASATALAGLSVILPVKMVMTSWCAAFAETASPTEMTALKNLGDAIETKRRF